MINSMLNSIIGSPQVSQVASNITIATSNDSVSKKSTSNSTACFENSNDASSPDISKNISPSISPVKTSRENSMSKDSSESIFNQSISLNLKHNTDAIDLENSLNQKIAIQYLLDKVRDNEKLLVAVAKENRTLSGELSDLYSQNDALAAENISLKDTVSLLEQNQSKFVLVNEQKCDETPNT